MLPKTVGCRAYSAAMSRTANKQSGNLDKGPTVMVWHDEADRLATWGSLDPPDACMCRECVLSPGEVRR